MTHLTYSQIEGYWIEAGGSKALAPLMAAIAMAESGGNTEAHNGNAATGDDSYGLWQINYYGSLLPGRTAEYGPPTSMFDPANNAKAAVSMAGNGAGLGNWTTYTSGAYRQYLNGSANPTTNLPASNGNGGTGGGTANATPASNSLGSSGFTAEDASFWGGLKDQLHFDTGILGDLLPGTSGSGTPTPRQEAGAIAAVPKDMYKGVAQIAEYVKDGLALFMALFRPSFWLRVGAFFVGVIAAAGGIYFLVSGTTGINATDLAMKGPK